MTSFFGKLKKFQPVPEDGKINTQSFLDACKDTFHVFEYLGSGFARAQGRIGENVTKVRKKFDTDKEKFETLQDIVNSEIEEKTSQTKNSGTEGCLMLKRALTFIRLLLGEILISEEENLVNGGRKAYENSLKQYHGWIAQKAFGLAIKGIPYRKNLLKALGPECTEDVVLSEMKETIELIVSNINTLNKFFEETGQEKNEKA